MTRQEAPVAEERVDLVAEARRQWVAHGWDGPDRGMSAVISLMRAQQIVLGRLEEALRPFGLSYARYELLTLLSFTRTGELPLSRVGDRLQVHPASVTGAVDKLEQQGLVVRVPHPGDRRAVLARITEQGRAVAEQATAALNAGPFADLGLPADDTEQLVALLTRLRRSAGDF
jgi:DNA-binding MarR family transcriptional regulator